MDPLRGLDLGLKCRVELGSFLYGHVGLQDRQAELSRRSPTPSGLEAPPAHTTAQQCVGTRSGFCRHGEDETEAGQSFYGPCQRLCQGTSCHQEDCLVSVPSQVVVTSTTATRPTASNRTP